MVALGFPATKYEKLRNVHDLDVRRRTEHLFQTSGYLALRDIKCEPREGRLHLCGRLPSYYLKQVAQSIAEEFEGVCELVNEIEVVVPSARRALGMECGTAVIPTGRFPV